MQSLIAQWSGESVVTTYDRTSATWMFIAIHDTTLGPAMGGCRIKKYPSPDDGLRDAMRLAEGMTYKWAAIEFDLGGGKSVLAVERPLAGDERRALLRRFGRLIASLRGAYACGPDLGSTPEDMAVIGEETAHVHGYDRATGQQLDPGPYTALGVVCGMRAALHHVDGSNELAGRRIVVQGVGDVGVPLARLLAEAGATLILSDSEHARAEKLAQELGADTVSVDALYDTPCDVYAPCAVGATVNSETIPRLACRIVAGSANNQLQEQTDAERLHARGILYAPDYIVNAGGATALPLLGKGHVPDAVRERIRAFEETLAEIFAEARSGGESPFHAAQRRVERILDARRQEKRSAGQ
jgi:leucine dehydrogenase